LSNTSRKMKAISPSMELEHRVFGTLSLRGIARQR
jgi:hypothetical protein